VENVRNNGSDCCRRGDSSNKLYRKHVISGYFCGFHAIGAIFLSDDVLVINWHWAGI